MTKSLNKNGQKNKGFTFALYRHNVNTCIYLVISAFIFWYFCWVS